MSITDVTDPDDGRNRRKVMFRSDDMHFSDLDESDNQDNEDDDIESDIEDIAPMDDENDTDSEWIDTEEETENKTNETDKSRFYGRSFGKENEIRKKIANELAKLDKINQESNIINWNEQEHDYSDDAMAYDEDSDMADESENEDFNDKSNEEDDLSDGSVNDKDANPSLVNKNSIHDLQEANKDTRINWKTNLAQKAAYAYYERQNSVANLWKLVYGK